MILLRADLRIGRG